MHAAAHAARLVDVDIRKRRARERRLAVKVDEGEAVLVCGEVACCAGRVSKCQRGTRVARCNHRRQRPTGALVPGMAQSPHHRLAVAAQHRLPEERTSKLVPCSAWWAGITKRPCFTSHVPHARAPPRIVPRKLQLYAEIVNIIPVLLGPWRAIDAGHAAGGTNLGSRHNSALMDSKPAVDAAQKRTSSTREEEDALAGVDVRERRARVRRVVIIRATNRLLLFPLPLSAEHDAEGG